MATGLDKAVGTCDVFTPTVWTPLASSDICRRCGAHFAAHSDAAKVNAVYARTDLPRDD